MQSLFYIPSVLQFYQQMKHVFVSPGIRHCVVCCVCISIWKKLLKNLRTEEVKLQVTFNAIHMPTS